MFSAASRANFAFSRLAFKSQKRAHGNFSGNSRVEEYAGLREISYWSWEFTATSIARITGYMIIPGALFYTTVVAEFVSIIPAHCIGLKHNYS